MHTPPHPGTVLKDCYFDHLEISIVEFAAALGMTRQAVSAVLNGKAGISSDLAVKLGKFFDTTPELWSRMQAGYDLAQSKKRVDLSNVKTAVFLQQNRM